MVTHTHLFACRHVWMQVSTLHVCVCVCVCSQRKVVELSMERCALTGFSIWLSTYETELRHTYQLKCVSRQVCYSPNSEVLGFSICSKKGIV